MREWGACPPFQQNGQPNTLTQTTVFQKARMGGLPPILAFWPPSEKRLFWGSKTKKDLPNFFGGCLEFFLTVGLNNYFNFENSF